MKDTMSFFVTKRDGNRELFDANKINKAVERACVGLEGVSVSEVVLDAKLQLFEGVKTSEIDKSLIMSARSKVEYEPNYSYVAASILLSCIYKEAFGFSVKQETFEKDYRITFVKNLKALADRKIVDSAKLSSFDLEDLASFIRPERDLKFKYLGLDTLYSGYLQKIEGVTVETPQALFMRVAMGLAWQEKDPNFWAKEFYEILSTFSGMCSTPTLFNSLLVHNQLSSCYLSTVEDSIDGIFGTLVHDQSRLAKYAGGIGVDITPLRGTNSNIRNGGAKSTGIIGWAKSFNSMIGSVNQEGKRKGSGALYLEPWHTDIYEFCELRKGTGDERLRCHETNTALWIPDLLMKRVRKDGEWTLFCPNEFRKLHDSFGVEFENEYVRAELLAKQGKVKNFKTVKAKDLYKHILRMALETGHPWLTFKDISNYCYTNLNEGIIHCSNLCTEILRHNLATQWKDGNKVKIGETAVCNLASLNYREHISGRTIDIPKLIHTIRTLVRMLDNVIDQNFYPLEEAKISNLRHRPIGLGACGFQDILFAFGIPYDSNAAVDLSGTLQEIIAFHAFSASCDLAKERGTFPSYSGSPWSQGEFHHEIYDEFMKTFREGPYEPMPLTQDWETLRVRIKEHGIRNASIQAIAPTASLSYIVGAEQSIEPSYGVIHVYSRISGEYTLVNDWFVRDCKKLVIWSKELVNKIKAVDSDLSKIPEIPAKLVNIYKGPFQIDYKKLIDCAAARQRFIDMGQSFNIYCDIPSLKAVSDRYMYAWEKGLKTTYYLRSKGASAIEKVSQAICSILNKEECESCQ